MMRSLAIVSLTSAKSPKFPDLEATNPTGTSYVMGLFDVLGAVTFNLPLTDAAGVEDQLMPSSFGMLPMTTHCFTLA